MTLQTVTTVFLAMVLSIAADASASKEKQQAPADNKQKLAGAIRHRCVLECVWLKDSGLVSSKSADKDMTKVCVAACMDPKAIKAAVEKTPAKTWGASIKESIDVCLPPGEQRFLSDLRCPGGKVPGFERVGSMGSRNPIPKSAGFDENMMNPAYRLKKGQIDTHIIDMYKVSCPQKDYSLYFDMYHCGTPKPWAAPEGFTRPPYGE